MLLGKSIQNPCYQEVYEFTNVHPKNLTDHNLVQIENEILSYFQKNVPTF